MVRAEFGIVDVAAKPNCTLTQPDQQPFAALRDMLVDGLSFPHVATGEDWQWALDGTYECFPDDPALDRWGLFSVSMSNDAGIYETPVVLVAEFSQSISSVGVTLRIPETVGYSVHVQWFDGGGNELSSGDYVLDAEDPLPYIENYVSGYRRIDITFTASSYPHRYVRVSEIAFGLIYDFGGDTIKDGRILEQFDPMVSELPYGTLNLTIETSDVNFSIFDPQGIFSWLLKQQPISIWIDERFLGTYYLNEWDSAESWKMHADELETHSHVTFRAVDALGVLDGDEYTGGVYTNQTVKDVVDDIMSGVNISYTIDADVAALPVRGWLPINTKRSSLQQVLFAAGAYADCVRKNYIEILPLSKMPFAGRVDMDRCIIGAKTRIIPAVSGVKVIAYSYKQVTADTAASVWEGNEAEGQHRVEFGSPCYALSATNCSIISSGVNYAIINVTAAQAALDQRINGKSYKESKTTFRSGDTGWAIENTLVVENATLVTRNVAQQVADRLLEYNQKRYEIQSDILLGDERPAANATMYADWTHTITGQVLEMEIDLGKEVVKGCKVRGLVD